jgi:hypothetical protein
MRITLMLIGLLWCGQVGAQGAIYTCDNGGRRVYQNSPCPSGAQTLAVRPYSAGDTGNVAEAERKIDNYVRELEVRRQSRQSTAPVRRSGGRSEVSVKVQRCRDAKRSRDDWRSRTAAPRYEDLRHWDTMVYEACQGVPYE